VSMTRLSPPGGEGSPGPNPSDLPPGFEQDLARLIDLAEAHAPATEICDALGECVPTYRQFDWSTVGSFPGVGPRVRTQD